MHRPIGIVLLLGFIAVVSQGKPTTTPGPADLAEPKVSTTVTTRIPPEVFESAGLTKLSAQEFGSLNAWIEAYVDHETEKALRTGIEANPNLPAQGAELHPNPLEVIESQIDGEFEGWNGDTTYRLQNGQLWQQASFSQGPARALNPTVIIFRQMGGYRMKVEGVPGVVAVKLVK